ncbi:MAG: hypothetical protein ACT4P2_09210 [Pseudomonadota bacterium]
MMKRILFAAALLGLFAGPALAGQCPGHIRQIDAELAKTLTLPAADIAKARALRDEAQTLHGAGSHAQSMEKVGEAKKLLKM